MRFIKVFFGIILCVCVIGFLSATAQVDPGMRPFFIVLVCLCAVGAVLLLKRPKRAAKQPKAETPPVVAEGELVTVQTEYEPSAVPDDVAKEMLRHYTAVQAQRDMEIMAESYRLASTTKNLDTFCMRYELVLRKAHTLLQAEKVGVRGIKKLNFHDACTSIIGSAEALKVQALHNYSTEEIYKIEGLKTAKGKYNRYTTMLEVLEKAEPTFMFMDEYEALISKIKSYIAELQTK